MIQDFFKSNTSRSSASDSHVPPTKQKKKENKRNDLTGYNAEIVKATVALMKCSMGGATNFSKNVFWGPKSEFLNLGGPGLMGGPPVMMGVPSTPNETMECILVAWCAPGNPDMPKHAQICLILPVGILGPQTN